MNSKFSPQLTADGSFTFFSQEFDESFHSIYGAKQEAQTKFVIPCQLAEKAQKNSTLSILDICYGLGYNTASALETIWQINPHCEIFWVGLEFDAQVPKTAISCNLFSDYSFIVKDIITEIAQKNQVKTKNFQGKLFLNDARISLQELGQLNLKFDAVFLDPFSPPKCPQLWTVEFIKLVSNSLKETGILATYSCAGAVRKALLLANLFIGSTFSIGRKSPGTIASFKNQFEPLSQKEQEYLMTKGAIPYRDPKLTDNATIIKERRIIEQAQSNLETTSNWKRRWR